MKVKFYTIDCPKCHILEEKLNAKNIAFEKITDIEVMKNDCIDVDNVFFPLLSVDGELMEFSTANSWVNKK